MSNWTSGLDVSLKHTEICVVDAGGYYSRGAGDTHPETNAEKLGRWRDALARAGLETGSTTPRLARELAAAALPGWRRMPAVQRTP